MSDLSDHIIGDAYAEGGRKRAASEFELNGYTYEVKDNDMMLSNGIISSADIALMWEARNTGRLSEFPK